MASKVYDPELSGATLFHRRLRNEAEAARTDEEGGSHLVDFFDSFILIAVSLRLLRIHSLILFKTGKPFCIGL